MADPVARAQSRCAQAGAEEQPVSPVLSGGMGAGLGGNYGKDMRSESGRMVQEEGDRGFGEALAVVEPGIGTPLDREVGCKLRMGRVHLTVGWVLVAGGFGDTDMAYTMKSVGTAPLC